MGIISSLEWASAKIMDAHLFFLSSNEPQLFNQPWAFTPFIDHEKDIADIYADATLQIRFKSDITLIASQLPSKASPIKRAFYRIPGYRNYHQWYHCSRGSTAAIPLFHSHKVRNHSYEPDPVSPVVPRLIARRVLLSLGYLYPLSNNCTMRHHKDDTLR